jgi:hypothetical protein
MLEKLGHALAGAALSIVLIPVAIALTAFVLWVVSLPLRLLHASPRVAAGVPAVLLGIWTLWYGQAGLFRVALQYGIGFAIVSAFWERRDALHGRQRTSRRRCELVGQGLDAPPSRRGDRASG